MWLLVANMVRRCVVEKFIGKRHPGGPRPGNGRRCICGVTNEPDWRGHVRGLIGLPREIIRGPPFERPFLFSVRILVQQKVGKCVLLTLLRCFPI